MQANRLITQEVRREPTHADAAIVWCSDPRFRALHDELVKSSGYRLPFSIVRPSGAKLLTEKLDEMLVAEIAMALEHKGVRKLDLMIHDGCLAYPDLECKQLGERTIYLQRQAALAYENAEATFIKSFPDLKIRSFVADFNGLLEVAPSVQRKLRDVGFVQGGAVA